MNPPILIDAPNSSSCALYFNHTMNVKLHVWGEGEDPRLDLTSFVPLICVSVCQGWVTLHCIPCIPTEERMNLSFLLVPCF